MSIETDFPVGCRVACWIAPHDRVIGTVTGHAGKEVIFDGPRERVATYRAPAKRLRRIDKPQEDGK